MTTEKREDGYDFGSCRLVATDMDGTFMDVRAVIPEENRRAAEICTRHGVIFVIASGRSYKSLSGYIGVEGENGFIIAHNGAKIATAGLKKELMRTPLLTDDAKILLSLGDELGATACVWADEDLYVSKKTPMGELYASVAMAKVTYFDAKDPFFLKETEGGRCNIDKIYWTGNGDGTGWKSEEFEGVIPETVACFTSGGGCMEFVDRSVSKGSALKKLCGIIGVDIKDTVAFGDSENDLSLVQAAGLGIAVANADPRVKAAAGMVTEAHGECGVAKAIERLFGKEQLRKQYGF